VYVRRAMATGMAARVLLPWLMVLPLLGGLIWWLVSWGLQPLTAIAHALSARTPQALAPLPTAGLPQEVRPLVTAMNDLLQRLAAALAAQQALIADAAHTLRTPLTAVALQAQIAGRATHDEERHQASRRCSRACSVPPTWCSSYWPWLAQTRQSPNDPLCP